MRAVAHHAEALALAKHETQDKAGQARGNVDNVAAGEVERADGVADQAAVAAPHHMRQRRIHHNGPNGNEQAHRAVLHAARQRARDNGGGDHAERHLEDHVGHCRVAVVTQCFGRLTGNVGHQALQPNLVEAPEERNRAVSAVCERPTENRPRNCSDADNAEHHHHGVHHVLAAGQTAVEERQTGRHQQDEHGAHKHERRRACIKHLATSFVSRYPTR